jgi:hypothetical protein
VLYLYTSWAREIKSGITVAKAALNKKIIFTSKLRLNLGKKLEIRYVGAWLCVVLEIGHFRK